jgi:hypothetical protein
LFIRDRGKREGNGLAEEDGALLVGGEGPDARNMRELRRDLAPLMRQRGADSDTDCDAVEHVSSHVLGKMACGMKGARTEGGTREKSGNRDKSGNRLEWGDSEVEPAAGRTRDVRKMSRRLRSAGKFFSTGANKKDEKLYKNAVAARL